MQDMMLSGSPRLLAVGIFEKNRSARPDSKVNTTTVLISVIYRGYMYLKDYVEYKKGVSLFIHCSFNVRSLYA